MWRVGGQSGQVLSKVKVHLNGAVIYIERVLVFFRSAATTSRFCTVPAAQAVDGPCESVSHREGMRKKCFYSVGQSALRTAENLFCCHFRRKDSLRDAECTAFDGWGGSLRSWDGHAIARKAIGVSIFDHHTSETVIICTAHCHHSNLGSQRIRHNCWHR